MQSLSKQIWELIGAILQEIWGNADNSAIQMRREVMHTTLLSNPSLPSLLRDWTAKEVAECVEELTRLGKKNDPRNWQSLRGLLSNPTLAELVIMHTERKE